MGMIDDVARALWNAGKMPDPPWEETSELQKRFYRTLARSALQAMRDPTEEMLFARGTNPKEAEDYWQAMLDVALAEGA
jgi:hypothetical protein